MGLKKGFVSVLFAGLALIAVFLVVASLAPKISEKLGNLSLKKDSQQSHATAAMIPVREFGPCYPYGDANSDYKVNTQDALLLKKYNAGLEKDKVNTKFADVNFDNKIDILDAQLIENYDGGQSNTFPICTSSAYKIDPKGPCYPKGDINLDNKVNFNDNQTALNYDVGLVTLSRQQVANGDLNMDKKVDKVDGLLILRYLQFLDKTFPACNPSPFPSTPSPS